MPSHCMCVVHSGLTYIHSGSLAPIDAATQAAIDKGLRVAKRKAAPSLEDNQKDKVSRTGEKEGVGAAGAVTKPKLADVKSKFMTMFKKDDDIGGVEDIEAGPDSEIGSSVAHRSGVGGLFILVTFRCCFTFIISHCTVRRR